MEDVIVAAYDEIHAARATAEAAGRAHLDAAMRHLHRIDEIWDCATRPEEKPDRRDY
jgi:hypothetical protein